MSGVTRQRPVSVGWRWKLSAAIVIGLVLGPRSQAEGRTPTPTSAAAVVSVVVGSATGKPGDQVTIDVTLHTAGFAVVGVQNDITFFPGETSLVGCTVNPELGKNLTAFGLAYSGLRAIVFGTNVDPIPDGAVLYTCTFNVTPGAAPGDWPLSIARVGASSPEGQELPVAGSNGFITVPGTRPTRTPTPSPAPVEPAIVVDSVSAAPGEKIPVSVRLRAGGATVAGTQNDLEFDGVAVRVVANANGRPDCLVNPDIDKPSTGFAFQPPGCSGSECTAVRALVLSFATVDPIPDGATLYTCTVSVSEDATPFVEHPLGIAGVMMSDPSGQPVDGIGIKGSVFVVPPVAIPTPVHPSIVVNPVRGQPGDDVSITARLVTAGASVIGTQNDIVFDSLNTPIAAFADGKPDCGVNPDIGIATASFAFLPSGCSGSACTAMRAVVFSADTTAPIADGAALYTCTISIASTAPTGVYPLSIDGVGLGTPEGQEVPGATESSSAVLVGIGHDPHDPNVPGGPPEPAATQTASPSRGPTAVATALPQRTATALPGAETVTDGGSIAAFQEGGGCTIGESREAGGLVILLLPVVLLIRAKARSLRACRQPSVRR